MNRFEGAGREAGRLYAEGVQEYRRHQLSYQIGYWMGWAAVGLVCVLALCLVVVWVCWLAAL